MDLRTYSLRDTAEKMESKDYRERFWAEYWQLSCRLGALRGMLMDWERGNLDFEPVCSKEIYEAQERAMSDYSAWLEARAQIEGIDLS